MNPLVSENKETYPILVVDREGIIGSELSQKLSGDAQVVFVSEKILDYPNTIHIPYAKKFPVVPDSSYSHIFIIDNGKEGEAEALSSFLKKARDDKSVLIFATHVKNQKFIGNEMDYRNMRIVLLGDLVDKPIPSKSYVNKLLSQARERGKIIIPGDGMDLVYPVFFDDSISGILEAAFGTSSDRIYYLFPKHGVTLLSLAHAIQKINPEINIDFSKQEKIEGFTVSGEGKYLLPESYPLDERIRNLNIQNLKNKINHEERTNREFNEEHNNKNIKVSIFFLALFLFLPLITTLLFSLLGTVFLNSTKVSLGNGSLDNAAKSIDVAKFFFSQSEKTSNFLVWETAGLDFSKSLESLSENGYKGAVGINEFFQGINFLSQNKTDKAIESFKDFLVFAQNEKANNRDIGFFNVNLFNIATETVDLWPQILGFDSQKKYLILLQNNLKVRPTGGVIESYGILTIDKGIVKKFQIYNISNLDSKLKGRVEPPFPVRRFLGETNWIMRDSNFDIDFANSASSSAFFANLETGENIDGVLAVDFNFIKEILKITGPIYLDSYKKSVNSNNIFQMASMGDKNFSEALLNTLEKIFEDRKISYIKFANLCADSFVKKSMIFASSSQNVQNSLTANNLSDSLWDGIPDTQKNINDVLGINDANFGAYTNELISRILSESLDMKDSGEISADFTLQLKNNGNYDYKNYLRIILPSGVQIKTIGIDGENKDIVSAITDPSVYEAKSFNIPQGLEVESYTEQGKSVIGFLVTVPKTKSQTIDVIYSLPPKPPLSSLGNFTYNLHFLKQPGVDSYPFEFSLNLPSGWRALSFPKGVNSNGGKISFSKEVLEDFDLNLNFSQK